MNVLERVQRLCKQQGVSIAKLERDIDLSKGAVYKWKNSNPSMDVLKKLSAYFNVPAEQITHGTSDEEEIYINDVLENILRSLDNGTGLYPSGKLPESDIEKEALANSIKIVMATIDSFDNK